MNLACHWPYLNSLWLVLSITSTMIILMDSQALALTTLHLGMNELISGGSKTLAWCSNDRHFLAYTWIIKEPECSREHKEILYGLTRQAFFWSNSKSSLNIFYSLPINLTKSGDYHGANGINFRIRRRLIYCWTYRVSITEKVSSSARR